MGAVACPPLELFLDELGRRSVPLASLRSVLEWQLQAAPEEASLEKLLEAVTAAEEAPLPGHTPARADLAASDRIPGLELAQPVERDGTLLHPAYDLQPLPPCSNCGWGCFHAPWCPVAPGRPIDPLAA